MDHMSLDFQLVLLRRMADHNPDLVEDARRELGASLADMREANKRWQAMIRSPRARAASSTVQDQGVRSSRVRGSGAEAPGARTSHSFHTAPFGASSTSKRRSGQRGRGHSQASQSRSPTLRVSTVSGVPSTER